MFLRGQRSLSTISRNTHTACTIWDRSLVGISCTSLFVGKQTEGKKRHVNEFCIVGVYIEETGISSKSDANLNVISIFFLRAEPYLERCRSLIFFSGWNWYRFRITLRVRGIFLSSKLSILCNRRNFSLQSLDLFRNFMMRAWCHNKSRLHSIRHPLVIYSTFFSRVSFKKWSIYKFRD